MSFIGLLINTVAITRPTATYVKGRSTKTYASVATGVKCRIQWVTREEIYPKTQGYEYAGEWNVFFAYGVDLLKDDLLVCERGRKFIVQSAPIDVTGMKHHSEVKIELVE